ncbi:MAG: ribonucleoside-diphosphate reductase subunit alpha [Sutterellaceae bacterium]|nr:ribonucleoside-diphosphate reductase subunit alpha [Sutterellaceae bacterium]
MFSEEFEKVENMAIQMDFSRDALFDELGLMRLRESYMRPEEKSPQERLAFVAQSFATDEAHAQRIYDYASRHWLSFSTPILSFGRGKRGLPISCFLSYMPDSAEGLVDTLSEVNWLSMLGGGVGIHVGIRSADEKSVGVMPHLRVYDAACLAYRQGSTRRGSYAAFLPIDHPDIVQFIEMRKPTGDPNMRALNLHHGINISDAFMEKIEASMRDADYDDTWELKSPVTGEVMEKVSARELWQRILEMRMHTGEPYLVFTDTANKKLPQWLKDKGLKIHGSNLCTEIFLPTSKDRTAVCCLCSLNLEYFDQWRGVPQFVEDVMEFLDNVLQYFIDHAPTTIERARVSAMRERSVGLGALGFHAYLQKNNIAFEGVMAKVTNMAMFRHIRNECERADHKICEKRGACPDAADAGVVRRFSHWMAVAPNASSSLIMGGTSPSIEPTRANVYRQDTISGAYIVKNRFLKAELARRGMDNDDVWADLIAHDGSIQHRDDLPQSVKDVFKTAQEIDQRWIVELAGDRQQFIDQGQSVNLFFAPDVSIGYLHACHFLAWKKGLKSLYYCRSDKLRKADKVGQVAVRKRIEDEIDMKSVADDSTCLACEG